MCENEKDFPKRTIRAGFHVNVLSLYFTIHCFACITVLTGSTFRKQSRRDIAIFHYLSLQVTSSSIFKDMAGTIAQEDQAAT
jgi:hypothetical protein